ncbi:hypothetical protein [Sphingomonas sp. R86521]|uniref:hypothetical protein n=1 Tax=Sphingomonas sp. R86521 TaxID=3093860 RepID=UPI0036D2B8B9
MTGGRPLRFLLLTLGGWIAIRTLALLPTTAPLPALVEAIVPRAVAERLIPALAKAFVPSIQPPVASPPTVPAPLPPPGTHASPPLLLVAVAAPILVEPRSERPRSSLPSSLALTPIAQGRSRLAGSTWLLARGGPSGSLDGGQLGASQAGLRVTYALGSARRIALAARVSAPIRGRGREASLGVEWQPTRIPVRLLAEHRISLDGGRGGPMLGIIGGYGPADIAPGIRLEAYGQAGAIARDGVETFVDTAARLTHPVAHLAGMRVDLGLGAWGSAQRGARRFDIGPTVGIAVPVAGKAIRLNLDCGIM